MRTPASAILTYHSLDRSGSVISVRPEIFRSQIQSLADSGIPVVPLEEIQASPGAVAITFDDGFRNLNQYAFPLLDRLHLPATVFVVSRYAGRRNDWPSQPEDAAPDLPLLDWSELASMPPKVAIGAHTVSHPHLPALSAAACEAELRECQDEIAACTGRRPATLAYPYGSVSDAVVTLAARNFDLAVGTDLSFVWPGRHRLTLPRLDMFYLRNSASLSDLFTAGSRRYLALRRAARVARSRVAGQLRAAAQRGKSSPELSASRSSGAR